MTSANPYDKSDMILSIGMKIMMLLSVYFLLALNLPSVSSLPANRVRELFGAPVSSVTSPSS